MVARITCYKCLKRGHFADFCPTDVVEGDQHLLDTEEVEELEETQGPVDAGQVEVEDEGGEDDASAGDEDDFEEWTRDFQEGEWGDDFSESDDSLISSFQYNLVSVPYAKSELKELTEHVQNPETKCTNPPLVSKNTQCIPNRYMDTDILIDTGSTTSVFKNPRMLLNIKRSERTLRSHSNGGSQDSNWVGYFPGMFKVWLNKKSMLNILSFSDVRKHFRITLDTAVESTTKVHLSSTEVLRFEEVESGPYLLRRNKNIKKRVNAYSFLRLVCANKSHFTKR